MRMEPQPLLVAVDLFEGSDGPHRVQHGRIRREHIGRNFDLAEIDPLRFPVGIPIFSALTNCHGVFLETAAYITI